MEFSTTEPTVMHIDINSCFATVEQQANPFLRGKAVAVAAYVEHHGCILAASVEAKRLGIKTGMRVREAKEICRNLVVLPPDPEKYRFVNRKLRMILESYTPYVSVESIDEMVVQFWQSPILQATSNKRQATSEDVLDQMIKIAQEIKKRIREEIGEWMTVSIGIAPNRYLAKVASGMKKPDGLVWITRENIDVLLSGLKLEDLCGIKEGNATRLRATGITSPLAMLHSSPKALQWGFRSIAGYHWWMRLHGYEGAAFAKSYGELKQKSFGQSHALGKPHPPEDPRLWQILAQLVMKMARRLREDCFTASGVSVSLQFADHSYWQQQTKTTAWLYADSEFYGRARMLLTRAPSRPIRILAVSCYDLQQNLYTQQSLLPDQNRTRDVTQAIDRLQDRFGEFVIGSGRMIALEQKVLDRIAFGRIRELNPKSSTKGVQ